MLFFTGARSLQGRSYAAGGTRYLHADLMLLTHAKYALKGPRGRFGISYPMAVRCTEQHTAQGSEIRVDRSAGSWTGRSAISARQDIIHRFAPLHCAVTAGAGLPPFTPEKAGAAVLGILFYEKIAYLYSSTRRVRCS